MIYPVELANEVSAFGGIGLVLLWRHMEHYSQAAVERAMKVHEVIMRAMSKESAWFQATEIIGISCRQMQRWKFGGRSMAMKAYWIGAAVGRPFQPSKVVRLSLPVAGQRSTSCLRCS